MLDDAERRRRLTVRHRLAADHRGDDPTSIADSLIALHSSDPATVHLSVAVRMADPAIAAVERAMYDDRTLVRHHAMRRTMWVMTPATARLAHAAATVKIARTQRARTLEALAESGVDDPGTWLDTATAEVHDLLAREGALSTREVGAALPHLAIPIEFGSAKNRATQNAHTKVLQGAGFDGVLVRTMPMGGWTSAEYRWSATDAWLDAPLVSDTPEAVAAGELLGAWLLRFGPATETDIAWWFGWTKTLTRGALATAGAEPVALESGGPAWVAPGDTDTTPDPGPTVRLLPGLDPTAMGWKQRDWYIDPAIMGRIFDRFGNIGPTILVGGRIVGGWAQRPDGSVALDLDEPLPADHERLLDEAVAELRDLLGDVVVKPRFPSPNQKVMLA